MRYELGDHEWAVIKLASIRIWLRAYESTPYMQEFIRIYFSALCKV